MDLTTLKLDQVGEGLLVREVLGACQGWNGRIVRYSSAAAGGLGGYEVTPEAGVTHVQRQMVAQLCEVGWLFRRAPCALGFFGDPACAICACMHLIVEDTVPIHMPPERKAEICP